MKTKKFNIHIWGFALLLYYITSCAQNPGKMNVTLSVSPEQEENQKALIAWLETHTSLKQNEMLKNKFQEVFTALKNNDYDSYTKEVAILNSILNNLSDIEKNDIFNFFLTLKVPTDDNVTQVPNSCRVRCLFGSCDVICTDGTKPKCFCQWGEPHCGCEPYGEQ